MQQHGEASLTQVVCRLLGQPAILETAAAQRHVGRAHGGGDRSNGG